MITSWFGEDFNKNPFDPIARLNLGGAELQTQLLAQSLTQTEEVFYVNLSNTTISNVAGVNVVSAPRRNKFNENLAAYRDLLTSALSSILPQVLISYLIYPCGDLAAHVANFHATYRPETIATICGSHEWLEVLAKGQTRQQIPDHVLGSSLKFSDVIFTRGKILKEKVLSHTKAKVAMLRPIVEGFYPNISSKTSYGYVFFYFARFSHPKRWDIAIDAFATGLQQGHLPANSRLIMAGGGPETVDALSRINQLPPRIKSHVSFKGSIDHAEINKLMSGVDACLHLSESEGYGTGPVESLLAGLPTVLGGFPSVADDFRHTGICIECSLTMESVMEAMIKCTRIGRAHTTDMLTQFSSSAIASKLLNRIQDSLAHRNSG